jgi:two-component system chemotaxis response regulator CheB
MIRILIVDDSQTARELLRAIFEAQPGLAVVGEAATGDEAIAKTRLLRPSVVTMDVLMPGMNGYDATKEIMITMPTPIVIVSSTVAGDGEAEAAVRALGVGAVAVSGRPPGPASPDFEQAAAKLVATVTAMASVKVVRHWRSTRDSAFGASGYASPPMSTPTSTLAALGALAARPAAEVVAIAASTGGPVAINALLASLPPSLTAPVLVVQHIAAGFTRGLGQWLATASRLRIKLAEDGERLVPGTVYLAPEGVHLGLEGRHRIELSTASAVRGFRPSATHLFASIAGAYGPRAAAVILTGMGDDGLEGLRAVKAAGGYVVAQDEATSVVFGMPKAAIDARLADAVLPLAEIGRWIAELCAPRGD